MGAASKVSLSIVWRHAGNSTVSRLVVVTALPSRPADVAAYVGLPPDSQEHDQVLGGGEGARTAIRAALAQLLQGPWAGVADDCRRRNLQLWLLSLCEWQHTVCISAGV